jgi:uncharacterized protein (TIGR02246 family)
MQRLRTPLLKHSPPTIKKENEHEIILITLAAVVTTAVSGVATAKAPAGDAPKCKLVNEAMIEAQFAKFNEAWATKDPTKVTALFSDDAVLLATVSNAPLLNHAQINDYFVGFLKNNPVGTIDSSTVKLGCNMATRLGTWTVTMTDAKTGTISDVKARYSFIYSYEGGEWKIAHLHSSMMPEPKS